MPRSRCNPSTSNENCLNRRQRSRRLQRHVRSGGVYIAVLGTSLIVALLGMSALMAQRIQNRVTTASADIRQAELNAQSAVEMALLTMKQNANWRTTQPHGRWFTDRSTGSGTCTVDVVDPIDSNLANNADDPVVIRGIGYSGRAEQRMEITIDPRREPFGCLRSAIAAGDTISLTSSTLRTEGLITANEVSAFAAQVYGTVEATSISGSTYHGATTVVPSNKRPAMPDWGSVFNYYRVNGTEIVFGNLSPAPNLGRNVGTESGLTDWTGEPPGVTTAVLESNTSLRRTGSRSIKVKSRTDCTSGVAQRIDTFVKPGQQYEVRVWIYLPLGLNVTKQFQITLYTKGTGGAVQVASGPNSSVLSLNWQQITATLTAPSWSGDLEYAFVKIAGVGLLDNSDFHIDDFSITEAVPGRFIYQKVIGPGVNTSYAGAPINSQGLYWINCNGNRLTIDRSRIVGTLLVLNPGADSCVDGPISWVPAAAGYPALLVDADNPANANFTIKASSRALSEAENGINFNPSGAPHEEFGQDADTNDIYHSSITGFVAIRRDLSYANRPLVRGQIVVGRHITSSGGELEVEYQPEALLNPPPGFWSYLHARRFGSARKAVLP